MANGIDPDIWYFKDGEIQTQSGDILIQTQAGKIFSHQSGGKIKFPEDQQVVNNACLCKYRYMRYYAFYQKVQDEVSKMPFFEDIQPDEDTDWIDYSTQDAYGYKWEICAGPIYLGCQPVGYLGDAKWHQVHLPYSSNSENVTTPSPAYIHQTREPNRCSLKMRIVCSYKCCNGVNGCGIRVADDSGSFQDFAFPVCAQDFYVSNIIKAKEKNDQDLLNVVRIRGTEQCCVYRVKKKFIQHSCDAITLRVWREMNPLPGQDCTTQCPECFEELPQVAKGWAMQKHKDCVYWILWVWPLNNCDKASICDKDNHWYIVDDFQGVPAEVLKGYGAGWQPPNAHDPDEQIVRCATQATEGAGGVYQWTSTQKAPQDGGIIAPPPPVQGNPCAEDCQRRNPSSQGISDSASFSGSNVPQEQKPCNEPDPQSKQYLFFMYDQFTVWYLQVEQIDPRQSPDSQICHPVYRIKTDPDNPDKLDWKKVLDSFAKYDYQLFQQNWFKGLQFRHFKGDKDKYYVPLLTSDDPPETVQQAKKRGIPILSGQNGLFVQDTTVNICGDYYQVYYMGCKCKDLCQDSCSSNSKSAYISSNVCTKWRHVGRLSQKKLQELGLCVDGWVVSTVDNTFSDMQAGPIGQYVYTAKAQQNQPIFCPDYPQAPTMRQWYDVAEVSPECSEDPDSLTGIQETVQWTHDFIVYDQCKDAKQAVFIQGWKLSPQPNAVLMPQDTVDGDTILFPGEACTVYYVRKRDFLPGILGPGCGPISPGPLESDSKLLDNVTIEWNLGTCLEGKRLVKYRYIQCEITPKNRKGWPDPLTWTEQKWTGNLSDSSYLYFNWGWGITNNPAATRPVVITDGGDVIPKVDRGQQEGPDFWLCKIYYIQKLGQYVLCGDKQDYDGPQHVVQDPFEDVYSRPSILWNQLQCLQFHKYVKYAYLQFQTPACPFQKGTQPRTELSQSNARGWTVKVKEVPRKAGTQDQYSDSDWKWGWLDINEPSPLANYLIVQPTSGRKIVRAQYSDSQGNHDYVCTAYYVYKRAQLIGTQEQRAGFQAVTTSSQALPPESDLFNTTIYWTSDCYSQYGRWTRYWQAIVTPSCDRDGDIYNVIQWSEEPVTKKLSSGDAPQGGWFHTNGTPAASQPQGIPIPGSDCTLLYRMAVSDGTYYCKQQIPPINHPSAQLTQQLKNLSISWAAKCAKLHRAVSYIMATVTPGECGTISDSITWGTPQTLFPGSDAQDIFDSQGRATYEGGWSLRGLLQPLLNTPPMSGTVINPDEKTCILYYFKILQDVPVCARSYTYSNPYSEPDLSSYAINWSSKCQGKKWYLRYAYRTAQQACSSDSIQYGAWVFDVFSNSTSTFNYAEGWYKDQDTSFPISNYLPPDGQGVSWAPYKTCQAIYLALGVPQNLCQKPQDNLLNPESGPLVFQLTRYIKYSYAQLIPYCANKGFVYGNVTTQWVELDQNQTAVLSGTRLDDPYKGASIDLMRAPVSCEFKIYRLVQGQRKYCCKKPTDTTVVQINGNPAIAEGAVAPSAGLASDCYTDYYYKWQRTRSRVCADNANGWSDSETQWQGTWVDQIGDNGFTLNNCIITQIVYGTVTYCKNEQKPAQVPVTLKPNNQWPANTPVFGEDCPAGKNVYYYWSRSIQPCCDAQGNNSTCGTAWTLVTYNGEQTATGLDTTAQAGNDNCSRYQLVYIGKRCTTGYTGYTPPSASPVPAYTWSASCYKTYYYYWSRSFSACCNNGNISTCGTPWQLVSYTTQKVTTTDTTALTLNACSMYQLVYAGSTCLPNYTNYTSPGNSVSTAVWDSCNTWTRNYCYTKVSAGIGSVGGGTGILTGTSTTLAGYTSGWYNGSSPTATEVSGTPADCIAYYITLGNIYCGYNPPAAGACNPNTNPGSPPGGWPAKCTSNKWYCIHHLTYHRDSPNGAWYITDSFLYGIPDSTIVEYGLSRQIGAIQTLSDAALKKLGYSDAELSTVKITYQIKKITEDESTVCNDVQITPD